MKRITYGTLAILIAVSSPLLATSSSAEAANFLGCKM